MLTRTAVEAASYHADSTRASTQPMADYIVIFGAAVRADGSPSGSLQRRCQTALRHGGAGALGPYYLPTGGVGQHGPAEALVMREWLLQQGVAESRIVLECEARDTLQSVRLCSRILQRRGDADAVLVATSDYHGPRCALLFRIAGFDSQVLPAAPDRPHLGSAKWLRYALKELMATPWDAAWLLWYRIRRTI